MANELNRGKVLLLFGIVGSLAETSIKWASLIDGFWVFVYGLNLDQWAVSLPRHGGLPR
jgi:hypothetical protein